VVIVEFEISQRCGKAWVAQAFVQTMDYGGEKNIRYSNNASVFLQLLVVASFE
jgi:hypothetical protein